MKIIIFLIVVFFLPVASAQTTVFVYSGSDLVASVGDGVDVFLGDRLGSNRLSVGEEVRSSRYLPFGQAMTDELEYGFTGKELDESGLHYFGARYYDVDLGRFTTVDPVQENHPYTYVDNNPMSYVDPSGMAGVGANTRLYTYGLQVNSNPELLWNDPAAHFGKYAGGVFARTQDSTAAAFVFLSGHHLTASKFLFGDEVTDENFYFSDLPRSHSTKVVVFSTCHIVMGDERSVDHVLGELLTNNPSLKLVLGYESKSGYDDTELNQALGAYAANKIAEDGEIDYLQMAQFYIREGQRLYNQGKQFDIRSDDHHQRRGFAAYVYLNNIEEEMGWHFLDSEGNLEKVHPPMLQHFLPPVHEEYFAQTTSAN